MFSKNNNTTNKEVISNIYTGRDDNSVTNINIYPMDMKSNLLSSDAVNYINSFINKSDEKIKKNFTDMIFSMKNNTEVNFSTEKILSSLGKIGIPIQVSISVIELVINELLHKKDEIEALTTNHIRQEIANAIYKIDNSQFSHKEIQNWGDYYVRRYGDPEQQMEIIMSNGKIEKLSSKFIKEILLLDVMDRIDSNIRFLKDKIEISESQKRSMGDEIKNLLLSINIYRIHYESLLIIVEELALQPPHPWFISEQNVEYIIEYNYNRFVLHKQSLLEIKLNNNIASTNLRIIIEEYLYHSCSTILSYYNLHIGCGIQAPLNNLVKYLQKYIQEDCGILLKYSKLNEIKFDLNKLNLTPSDFYIKLKNLKQHPLINKNQLTNKEVENLWKQLSVLNNFINEIITPKIRKKRFTKIITKNNLSDEEFNRILSELRALFPFVKFKYINKKSVFAINDSNENFMRNFKPKILITILSKNDKKNIESIENEIEKLDLHMTNLIFVITKENFNIKLEINFKGSIIFISVYELLKIIIENEKPLEGIINHLIENI